MTMVLAILIWSSVVYAVWWKEIHRLAQRWYSRPCATWLRRWCPCARCRRTEWRDLTVSEVDDELAGRRPRQAARHPSIPAGTVVKYTAHSHVRSGDLVGMMPDGTVGPLPKRELVRVPSAFPPGTSWGWRVEGQSNAHGGASQ